MIFVTGTKRSGTSMWMQILQNGGFPVLGEKFPGHWEETIRDANPHGFYESPLRNGVYFATNPDPRTGVWLSPVETRRVAVKVFIPGLVRSDIGYIERVVATMRPWREYCASIERLRRLEAEAQVSADEPDLPAPVYPRPDLEWWADNYMLISDIVLRRYPVYVAAYDAVLNDTEQTIKEVFHWLGSGDPEAAATAVVPHLRTQSQSGLNGDAGSDLDEQAIAVFDALYELVRDQEPLTNAFIEQMNDLHERLLPMIRADRAQVRRASIERRKIVRQRLKTRGSRS